MKQELDRFLALFDGLVVSSNAWMTRTPEEKLDWVPFDNPNMKFGDRISTITMRSVYIHTTVGEHLWAKALGHCADGASLKFAPADVRALTENLSASKDLIADSLKLHADNLAMFRAYSDEQLARGIVWSGRDWTVMGFLWAIYSHRAYHLGNIDIFMREADEEAPDYFSNFRQVMA